jgi:PAS domain S-box-containing protein
VVNVGEYVTADPSARASARSLDRLFELSIDMLGTASSDGYFTLLSPAWEQSLGWSIDALMGEPFISFVHPDDVAATVEAAAQLAEPGAAPVVGFENRYRTHDGRYRALEWNVITDEGVLYFVAHDVTDRKSMEAERDEMADTMKAVIESVADGIYVADSNGLITLINPAGLNMLGFKSAGELLNRSPHKTFHSRYPDATRYPIEDCPLAKVRTTGVAVHVDRDAFWRQDGSPLPVACSAAPIALANGTGSVVAFRDITSQQTERKLLREQERELLEARDFFTGLTDNMAEGMFALDHEGRVTFLNAAAEKLLGWSEAELIGQLMHETTHFERLDGTLNPADACPMRRTSTAGAAIRVERDVFIRHDGTRLPVSYSSSPLRRAGGLGSVVVFSDVSVQLSEELRTERELDKLAWVGRIQDALAQDRFVLYAQPIMDLRTQVIVQHELLIRMVMPDGEIVLPDRFLPAAEEFGLIHNIDRWVVQQSALLASAGHQVEFNLSAKSMGRSDMVATIAHALDVTGAPPDSLVCEITETALMADSAAGEIFVRSLRDLGCKVALDDFGVGYGGLAYLKRLPVSYLKIDMQFVTDLVTEPSSRHVVRAIVDLARSFGAKTVAEGAEDLETVNLLKEFEVDYVQGFIIGEPRPVDQVFAKYI